MFSWDISLRWTIETDQARTSEVEVRFYAETPARTRVELEHRHIDRHGARLGSGHRRIDRPEGWPLYLDRYAALLIPDSLAIIQASSAADDRAKAIRAWSGLGH